MSADPTARRDTPLARRLTERIRRDGPLPVSNYMDACLNDPAHGYYRTQSAIGRAGDFITAPEISQVFGELIGLWLAVVWQLMRAPGRIYLVELGPGRGTMMADALRAAGKVPGFLAAARVVLVEPSPVLAAVQRETLAGWGHEASWVGDLADVEGGPTLVVANEVLDVLPVRQRVRAAGGWHELSVGLDGDGRLAFLEAGLVASEAAPGMPEEALAGDILETRDLHGIAAQLRRLAAAGPLAGLLVDYGHAATGLGDTLQAVRAHAYEHPLTSPGEADLTAHVDFAAAGTALRLAGMAVERTVTQAELLGALGIAERASRLMSANPERAGEIETAVARLMAPQGMGTRFKALGVKSSGLPALPGF